MAPPEHPTALHTSQADRSSSALLPTSTQPPPPYENESRCGPLIENPSEDGAENGTWVTVHYTSVCYSQSFDVEASKLIKAQKSGSSLSGTSPPGSSPLPCPEPDSLPAKVPEFYQAITEIDEAHSDLQEHAKAICDITQKLLDLQFKISTIQEYWLRQGWDDMAHDVIPILDSGG
ncbi:hypothetical protein NMY22_g11503 [Coprinellus aureogranulatus]|nr:hypothetical protein NMY22_g11503 [Coprinellus aureogranulatus]